MDLFPRHKFVGFVCFLPAFIFIYLSVSSSPLHVSLISLPVSFLLSLIISTQPTSFLRDKTNMMDFIVRTWFDGYKQSEVKPMSLHMYRVDALIGSNRLGMINTFISGLNWTVITVISSYKWLFGGVILSV